MQSQETQAAQLKGKKIDLHVPTKADAYKFGRRQVKIKVID